MREAGLTGLARRPLPARLPGAPRLWWQAYRVNRLARGRRLASVAAWRVVAWLLQWRGGAEAR